MYVRDAHFALIFYDSSREDTLKSWKKWFDFVENANDNGELKKGDPRRTTYILIATKIDVKTQMKETTSQEFEDIKEKFDGYFEVSSKDNIGVNEFTIFLDKMTVNKVLYKQNGMKSSKNVFNSPFSISEINTFDTENINRLTPNGSNRSSSASFLATPMTDDEKLLKLFNGIELEQNDVKTIRKKTDCKC